VIIVGDLNKLDQTLLVVHHQEEGTGGDSPVRSSGRGFESRRPDWNI